jgi:hypothetical protein
VVVIDEVHNFVSRSLKKGGLATPIYDELLSMSSCKLLALSGTPVVNNAYEIARVVNLVVGHTDVYLISLQSGTQEAIDSVLESEPRVRSARFDPVASTLRVVFAPHGFKMASPDTVVASPGEGAGRGIKEVLRALRSAGLFSTSVDVEHALPLPTEQEVFDSIFVDWENGLLTNPQLLTRRMVGAISSFHDRSTDKFASVSTSLVHLDMSDLQFAQYAVVRREEIRREKVTRKNERRRPKGSDAPAPAAAGAVYKSYSLPICNFAFPEESHRPFFDVKERAPIDALVKAIPDSVFLGDNLRHHSPKFAAILESVAGAKGPVLVYSRLRRAEGAGLFARTLDANGWRRDSERESDSGSRAPVYATFNPDEGEDKMRSLLARFNDPTNVRGDRIRLLVITMSGAEGISLSNVRQVHIIESYWNHVRIDQVIGRAVRVASHSSLPLEDRRVDVYVYLVQLTEEQRAANNAFFMREDGGLTSDQLIHGIAMRKRSISDQVLKVVELAAVDCAPPLPCPFSQGRYEPFFDDELPDVRLARLVPVRNRTSGKLFYLDPKSNVLYDYERLRNHGVLSRVDPTA